VDAVLFPFLEAELKKATGEADSWMTPEERRVWDARADHDGRAEGPYGGGTMTDTKSKPPTCRVGSATATPCVRPATVRVNSEDEPDYCAAHAVGLALQTAQAEIQHVLECEMGQLEERIEEMLRTPRD
jgi:hypothetical protein